MKEKNKIYDLLNEEYVKQLFDRELMPKYPVFTKIRRIEISTPKNHIWEKAYHMVIKYKVFFLTNEGKKKRLTFYAVAHSEELRENVYDVLRYLWDHNFNRGYLTIPRPVFYSKHFNASFYRGVDGNHLYSFMRDRDFVTVEKIMIKAAKWFSKLHSLPIKDNIGINPDNNRIASVVPGVDHVFNTIKYMYPDLLETYKELYSIIIEKENKYLCSIKERCLIHGDAHPENVIRMSENKLAFIDFADVGVGDFARDLGTFMQQFEFMMPLEDKYRDEGVRLKKIFLNKYLQLRKIDIDEGLRERIDNYYDWTMLRTATYYLIREKPKYETGKFLLDKLSSKLLKK